MTASPLLIFYDILPDPIAIKLYLNPQLTNRLTINTPANIVDITIYLTNSGFFVVDVSSSTTYDFN